LSRRCSFIRVALSGQVGALVSMTLIAALEPTSTPSITDLAWGWLSGIGTGLAMMFLFRGMSRGAMSIVVPTSAVGGVALPVLVGVAILGERPPPPAWAGIALAPPALWLVSQPTSSGGPRSRAAVGDGLIAGLGIALQYLTLSQAGPESGIWAVVAGRVTSLIAVAVLGKTLRPPTPRICPGAGGQRAGIDAAAAVAGALAGLALVAYLLATRIELLAVAVVLSSLYPLIPVLLGVTVLRERLTWRQASGLAATLIASVLIATA